MSTSSGLDCGHIAHLAFQYMGSGIELRPCTLPAALFRKPSVLGCPGCPLSYHFLLLWLIEGMAAIQQAQQVTKSHDDSFFNWEVL